MHFSEIDRNTAASASLANRSHSKSHATVQLSRMISFRLTAEEYQRCHQICLERGISSISEFARSALGFFSQQPSGSLEQRIAILEQRLNHLTAELEANSPARAVNP